MEEGFWNLCADLIDPIFIREETETLVPSPPALVEKTPLLPAAHTQVFSFEQHLNNLFQQQQQQLLFHQRHLHLEYTRHHQDQLVDTLLLLQQPLSAPCALPGQLCEKMLLLNTPRSAATTPNNNNNNNASTCVPLLMLPSATCASAPADTVIVKAEKSCSIGKRKAAPATNKSSNLSSRVPVPKPLLSPPPSSSSSSSLSSASTTTTTTREDCNYSKRPRFSRRRVMDEEEKESMLTAVTKRRESEILKEQAKLNGTDKKSTAKPKRPRPKRNFSTAHMPTHNTPWSDEERRLFLLGLRSHEWGQWSAIAAIVGTRNALQTRYHARQYMKRMKKAEASNDIVAIKKEE